jgi:hypothetical protein
MSFTFYLGTHKPDWLWNKPNRHPLFVSTRQLRKIKNLKPANTTWALDSGGFTEISLHGKWVTEPAEYLELVAHFTDQIGNLKWASPQDWMCEPHMIQKTGLTVEEHQHRTIASYSHLTAAKPTAPIIPVLQGWAPDDYLRHAEMYAAAGIQLNKADTVGMGSVCRRAKIDGIQTVIKELAASGIKLHGFGLKKDGIRLLRNYLTSSDSMAWSYRARAAGWDGEILCGVPHPRAKSCTNCHRWATKWADNLKTL